MQISCQRPQITDLRPAQWLLLVIAAFPPLVALVALVPPPLSIATSSSAKLLLLNCFSSGRQESVVGRHDRFLFHHFIIYSIHH